ncbi:MFS transporter [Microlunatus soli]|uniref:Predicted arabinose efflux permease, MFS family n=1 Tax=Microlunatus soli TaxID=630515 RepID=A0A1H1WEX3_9ACTN|nr:MFS transporter [Microlunatus soli]SDS95683.1 Predicted arabinose efflux permease, MFS family [Microlunatus soli]
MSPLVERILPSRMGRDFRWLMASSWTSNIGDGIALAAGPLLVASQTDSAFVVALAALLQRLPWLVFGLWAGALADRLDRRRVVMISDTLRAGVIAVLCLVIVTGRINIGVILVAMTLYGVAEVFADTTTSTLLPMMVDKADLGTGNQRLQAGFLTCNQLLGPPVGAFLFAIGSVWPFAVQVICVLLAVLLVSRIARSRTASTGQEPCSTDQQPAEPSHIRRDIAEGLRWIWQHAAVRTLALVILVFNVTWAAAWSVLVLWSRDHLGMSEVGYGLLTTGTGVGGLIGTALYGAVERRFALATVMRVCLLLEVLTHLALALTDAGWLAIVIMVEFGAYGFIWGTVSNTVRQRAVPQQYQGRVSAVYMMCVFGGLIAGQAIGGLIAEQWGLVAPFWFAFAGAGITLILVWRQLASIAHAGDDLPEPTRP